jgi:hypothetical protein
MLPRVRLAGRLGRGELAKDPLPFFLYASKRCSPRSDHLLLLRSRAALLDLAIFSIIAAEVRISSSVVIDIQCSGINRQVKIFRDRWQFKLKIVCHIIPDPDTFEETFEGPLLILGGWYCLYYRRRTPGSL